MLVPNYFYAPNTIERKSTGLIGGIENYCNYLRPVLVILERDVEWNGK